MFREMEVEQRGLNAVGIGLGGIDALLHQVGGPGIEKPTREQADDSKHDSQFDLGKPRSAGARVGWTA